MTYETRRAYAADHTKRDALSAGDWTILAFFGFCLTAALALAVSAVVIVVSLAIAAARWAL